MILIQIACLLATFATLCLCIVTGRVRKVTIALVWVVPFSFFVSFVSARYVPQWLMTWLIVTIFVIAVAAGAVAWEEYRRPHEDGWITKANRQLLYWLLAFAGATVVLMLIEPKATRTPVSTDVPPFVAPLEPVSSEPTPAEQSALEEYRRLRTQNP